MSGVRRYLSGHEQAKLDAKLFAALCEQNGLPRPVLEHRFAKPRRWAFDFAWLDAKIALESEGAVWQSGRHTRGSGYIADMEKYSEAAILGWRVLRVNRLYLMEQGLALVRRAFAAAPPACAAVSPPTRERPRITQRKKPQHVTVDTTPDVSGARPRCEIEIRPL